MTPAKQRELKCTSGKTPKKQPYFWHHPTRHSLAKGRTRLANSQQENVHAKKQDNQKLQFLLIQKSKSKALKEILKFQQNTDLLIQKSDFERQMKEVQDQ